MPPAQPFWNWYDVLLFFGIAVPCLVAAVLLLETVFLVVPPPPVPVHAMLAESVAYGLWFAALFLQMQTRYGWPLLPALAWISPSQRQWLAVLLGLPLAAAVSALGVALGAPQPEDPFQAMPGNPVLLVLTALFAVGIGPLCEELAFRGFVLPVALRSFGTVGGLVVTAIPFALLHGPQYHWSWQLLLLLVLAGTAFGYVRWKSGSTAVAVLVHAGYNLTYFIASLVQRSGTATP